MVPAFMEIRVFWERQILAKGGTNECKIATVIKLSKDSNSKLYKCIMEALYGGIINPEEKTRLKSEGAPLRQGW